MTLQSSGAISLADVQTEFKGSNPIGINEYYGRAGVPASGTISLADFYGKSNRQDQLVTLTGTGYYTVPAWVTSMDIVIVAGGGGGGAAYWKRQNDGGGGGGAGGVIYLANQTGYATGNYYYSTGAGGSQVGWQGGGQGYNGSNSVFYQYTAIGGGGGGGTPNPSPINTYLGKDGKGNAIYQYRIYDGMPGGSGGGGNAYYGQGRAGAGTAGQGYAGGNGYGRPPGNGTTFAGGDGFNGGGGGAGGPGQNNWYSTTSLGASGNRITGGEGLSFLWYSYSGAAYVGPRGLGGGGGAGSGFGVFELNPDNGIYAWPTYGGGNGAVMYGHGVSGSAYTGGGGGGGSGILDWGSYSGNGGSGVIYLFMKNY